MNKFDSWKSLRSEYELDEILDALFASMFYALLIFIPVYIGLVEIITVNLHLLTILSFVIIIAVFINVYVVHLFWKKGLILKKKDHETDIKKLFFKSTLIVNAIMLVIGILVIFVLLPMLMV